MNGIHLAEKEETQKVYDIFQQYKDVFPHLRFDHLQRKIETKNCILDNGVAITFTVYKKKNKIGTSSKHRDLFSVLLPLHTSRGDVVIHQIANEKPSNGQSKKTINKFAANFIGKKIWLTVRQSNIQAIKFYGKMNFENVGTVFWKNGTLPGYVFCLDQEKK